MKIPGRLIDRRWGVVAGATMILLCLGVAYTWGVFLIPIDQDMGWGRARIAFAVSILLLVFSVFMPLGGLLEKRIGPSLTAAAGGILVALGWVLASKAQTPLMLYLTYGILGGMGTGLSYMPAIASGVRCFPEKKGLISGIIVFGFGFGAAFLSPLITRLIAMSGWRMSMMICGVVFGAVIVLCSRFLKPAALFSTAPAVEKERREAAELSPGQMLRTRAFKIMFAGYLMAMIAGMMTIGHLVAFGLDRNLTLMQGAFALTVLAMFNGAGRILSGYLSDAWGRKRILVLLFLFIGGAMFVLPFETGPAMFFILAALIGFCFGGFLSVYPSLVSDYFGSRDFPVNYGLVFIGYGSGCFMGPWIGGIVHDLSGNYLPAFLFAGFLALAGGVMTAAFLKAPTIGKT